MRSTASIRPDCVAQDIALLPVLGHNKAGLGVKEGVLQQVFAPGVAAIALYEKHGFHQAGLRPGYYQHPREDAVIMTRGFSKEESL